MALPVYTSGYQPSGAGAITPQKYTSQGLPTPGKNYMIWGEQVGWIYNPYSDRYEVDPAAAKKYGQATGQIAPDPKEQSMTDIIGPLAAVAGTTALSTELGKSIPGWFSSAPATSATGVGAGQAIATDAAAMQSLGSLGGGAGMGVAQGGSAAGEAGLLNSSFLGEAGGADIGSDFLAPSGGVSDAASLLGTGPQQYIVPGLGAALGLYGMYESAQSGNKRTGIGGGLLSGAGAGASIGSMIPGGTVPGAIIGAAVGGLLGATAHESTNNRTKRRYGELEATDNAAFEAMKQKGQEWSLSGQDTWDIGDDKSAAPIDDMVNSYGVLKTFGPEWTQYSEEQRKNIVQGLVNADKINSKQGEYIIDDAAGAKEIAQSIAGAPAGQAAAPAANSGASYSAPARTNTDDDLITAGLIGSVDKKLDLTPGKKAPKGRGPGAVSPIAISLRGQGPGGLIR